MDNTRKLRGPARFARRVSGLQCTRPMVFFVLLLSSCGSMENGRRWGQDAQLWPGWSRISRAAMDSALDLQTLLPAAGAVLFTIGDWDEEVSDWATGENPLFSSERTAKDFSDWGVGALGVEFVATALMTPSAASETGDWKLSKFKGFLVEGASAAATWGVTEGLKNVVQRTRPDREDTKSFPSGHTSGAFSFATLANRNLNSVRLPNEARLPLQIANLVTATAVGWARVEGDKHFPSDVLAGAALGHFVTAFIHDAFLGLPEDKRFGFTLYRLDTEGVVFGISADF